MLDWASTTSRQVDVRPTIPGWRMTAEQLTRYTSHVILDPARIPEMMPWIAPGPVNQAWVDYVGPVDPCAPELPRLVYELALTISQFGGFIAYHPDGSMQTWKHDGSGIRAILKTMAAIRTAGRMPGIDVHDDYDRHLAHFFIDCPFGKERLSMIKELARPQTHTFFNNMLDTARRRDGSYGFNVLHMIGLACRFPLSFGEDPVFYKKASLLLMTVEIAFNQLGERAIAHTLPPADYRIPQILEGLGILRLSDHLAAKIEAGHIFRLDDEEVHALRSMTVEAVGQIRSAYERIHARPITCAELDGMLYLLSRNPDVMARRAMKPHIKVATAAF